MVLFSLAYSNNVVVFWCCLDRLLYVFLQVKMELLPNPDMFHPKKNADRFNYVGYISSYQS